MENMEYFTIDKLCAYLGLGRTTVYQLIHDKKIPAKKIATKWIVAKSDADKFLSADSNT